MLFIPAVTRPANEKSAYPGPILLTAVSRPRRAARCRLTMAKYHRSSSLSKTDEKSSLCAQMQTTTKRHENISICNHREFAKLTNSSCRMVGLPDARRATSLLSMVEITPLASRIPQILLQKSIVAAFTGRLISAMIVEKIFLLHDDG